MESDSDTLFTLNFNIKEIPFNSYPNDFTFIVNGKEYVTNRLVADIISPTIRKLHLTDETIQTFTINTTEISQECDFTSILSLISFESIHIKKENLNFFASVFLSLGNEQALTNLLSNHSEEITLANVFDIITSKQKYFQLTNEKSEKFDIQIIQSEIDYIANHFYEIDLSKVKKLDPTIIESIVENENLQLRDEDSLISFITDLYSQNSSLSYLFEYVNFLNVSHDEFDRFVQIFDLNDINGTIWNSIINRTIHSKVSFDEQISIQNNHKYFWKSFLYENDYEFNGIIKYLTDKAGENIHDKGLIEISTNSLNPSRPPQNLLDFNKNSFFEANENISWIIFDFKKMRVKLQKYQIKSVGAGVDQYHLKNWLIEVSNDRNNWKIVDKQFNCSKLNGKGLIGTFDVLQNDFSRYIRLRQTGELWGDGYMWLSKIEFYGWIQE